MVRRIWVKFKIFMTAFPKYFGVYLGLCGLWGFSCFICEEAIQTSFFSTWQAIPCEEWRLVKRSLDNMRFIKKGMVIINHCGGQINPLAYFSYVAYARSTQDYIDALEARVFANAPALFENETLTFHFKPLEKEQAGDYWMLRNNMITVISQDEFDEKVLTGKITVQNEKVIIDVRKQNGKRISR